MELLHSNSAVIIANGRFPKHPTPLSYIEKAQYIVCSDGASNDFIARGGGIPDAIVGDCDSISEENKLRFADILHPRLQPIYKRSHKICTFCVENGRREIVIVGGTGKREDHTLGNISLLAEYMLIAKVIMVTDWGGVFTPINENNTFKSTKGEQVSLFSIDREKNYH